MVDLRSYRLQSCPKNYTVDQDKVIDPMATVRKVSELLGKMYDLSSFKLEARPDAIEGAYSVSSISDQLNASGKGLTPEQSQASAIMEFVERYSWLHYDYEHADGYTVKSWREVKKEKIPTVDEKYFLNNFIGIENASELTKEIAGIPLKWVKSLCLNDYKEFYYPLNWHNYVFTSNGLSAGNVIEETILQGLSELVERENVYRFLGDRRPARDINQWNIKNPLICRVLENAKKKGITFIIKDLSFDFGIPTILVQGTSRHERGMLNYKGCGYGTHPSPEKALIRALSEYFESYTLLVKPQKELDLNWNDVLKRMPRRNYGFTVLYSEDMFEKSEGEIDLNDIPDLSRRDIKDELEHYIKILKKEGHLVYLIDKTYPKLGIPVVRLFSPLFRNLIVSEFLDPFFILSEAYYEAGNPAMSEEYLKKSLRKMMFHAPLYGDMAKPQNIYKGDYRETLLSYGSFKKDAVEILKDFGMVYKR